MEQFERIRRDHREEGVSIRELARRHRVHRRAVRQALASAVPPPRKPVESRVQPAIGAHAATIRAWLVADADAPRKQRHTARRIWERLLDEHGADVAESHRPPVCPRVPPRAEPRASRRRDRGSSSGWRRSPGRLRSGRRDHRPASAPRSRSSSCACPIRASLSTSPSDRRARRRSSRAMSPRSHVSAGCPPGSDTTTPVSLVARVLSGRDRTETERFIALRIPLWLRLLLLHPGRGRRPREGRHRGRGRPPAPALLRAGAQGAEPRRSQPPTRRGGPARSGPPHRRSPGDASALWARPTGRHCDRCLMLPSMRPGSRPSGSTPRPGSASASASIRCLPDTPAERLSARIGGTRIEVVDGGTVVASHERSTIRGSQTLLLDHYLEILSRKPGAMPGALATHQARERGVLTAAHEAFWARARRKSGDAGGTRALIEVLLLHRRTAIPGGPRRARSRQLARARPILLWWPSRPAGSPSTGPDRLDRSFGQPSGALSTGRAPVLTVYDGLLARTAR